jgi:hypothetical protein
MRLDCVLTAVNDNRVYSDFVPIFIKTWNKLYPEVDVKIIIISNNIPDHLQQYKNSIILFPPIQNILTSFTSQIIRLFYPAILDYSGGILITDIDMIPMNKTYYTKNISTIDDSNFIYMRGKVLFEQKQIAMCYNVATPSTWKSIFNIKSVEDIRSSIIEIFTNNDIKEGSGNNGWFTDQLFLYNKVMEWNDGRNNLVCLDESKIGFKRLNRNTFNIKNPVVRNNIRNGIYSDYHCLRPMNKYSSTNYEIYNLL